MTKHSGLNKARIVATFVSFTLGLTLTASVPWAFASDNDDLQAPRGQDTQAPRDSAGHQ